MVGKVKQHEKKKKGTRGTEIDNVTVELCQMMLTIEQVDMHKVTSDSADILCWCVLLNPMLLIIEQSQLGDPVANMGRLSL